MYVVIRQYGKTITAFWSRCRLRLSEKAIALAKQTAESHPAVQVGYYDIVLSSDWGEDTRNDIDSVIEVK